MESLVGIRYATSLFEVGVQAGCLDQLFEEVEALAQLLAAQPEFLKLLGTPVVAKEEKHQLLTTVFAQNLHTYLNNFLRILVDKNRFAHFPEIAREFKKLCHKHQNIQEATAITAVPLSPELLQKLKEKLESVTGKTILLQNKVDSTILGSVVLKVENDELDDSVKARLEGLRRQIAAAGA